MPSTPLSLRLTGYGLLGLLVQVPFTGTHTSLWMLAICGAGGLVLDGVDELLRVPIVARALGLLVCIYALGVTVGWAVEQVGGERLWQTAYGGFMRLDHAPYWSLLALVFRQVRHGLDRLYAVLANAPAGDAGQGASVGVLLPHEGQG